MEQLEREVKQSGILDKGHALPLSFYIIPPERHAHVYGTVQERASVFCSLDIVMGHSQIPVPKAPHFGFFTFRSTRDYLNKKYEEEMQEYEERSKIRKKYIDGITKEEWKAFEEHRNEGKES